jgi:hypothetical protein
MAARIVVAGPAFALRRPGRDDVPVRHNPWFNTKPAPDMARLLPVLAAIDQFIVTARDALAQEFGPIWRDHWKQPDQPHLTDAEFGAALTFVAIGYPDSQFGHDSLSLEFGDTGLLGGHGLFATLWLADGRLRSTEMFG